MTSATKRGISRRKITQPRDRSAHGYGFMISASSMVTASTTMQDLDSVLDISQNTSPPARRIRNFDQPDRRL